MQAQRDKVERLLKTARGQLDGILKMVEEDRYCMDISNQLLATAEGRPAGAGYQRHGGAQGGKKAAKKSKN